MAPATNAQASDGSDVSETRSVVDARIGQVVGGTYRITRHIGSGGSSHVFAAEHLRLGKLFAIKLLRSDNSRRAAQRFRREAKAVARLQSEHIISVIDCGELDDQTPYLVMALLEGEDLRTLLNREGSLPARRAVQIVIEACRGLTVVHEAGLVHRDLKPENLFIARRATGEDWCKILDFGVAKTEASLSTADGAIVGTVRYMAPEQLSDGASVGPASDVYALGAILYECLSGQPLIDATSVQEIMYRVMNHEHAALSTLVPTLPAHLTNAVDRCLSKDASSRPKSMTALAKLLEGVLVAPSARGARVDTLADQVIVPPRADKPRFLLAVSVTLALALVVLAVFTIVGRKPGTPTESTVAHVLVPSDHQPAVTDPGRVRSAADSASAMPTAVSPARTTATATASINRPHAAPRSTGNSVAAASARHSTPVGHFDETNPYGE